MRKYIVDRKTKNQSHLADMDLLQKKFLIRNGISVENNTSEQ